MKSIILFLALASIALCDFYYNDQLHRNYCFCIDSKTAFVVRHANSCSGINFSYKHMRSEDEIKDYGYKINSDYLDGSVMCGMSVKKEECPCPKFECEDKVCKKDERLKVYIDEKNC